MKFGWMALAALVGFGATNLARAEIKTEIVKYKAGVIEAQGYLAYDDAIKGKRPGVLIVPEWWGLDDYPKGRARQLAALGYVAFVADMYGNGMTTQDPKQAGAWAGGLKAGERKELRGRVRAGLAVLRRSPDVDPSHLAAIGYCFGGTTALELARSGADVQAIVCFHGGLDTAMPAVAGQIKAKVLVCHGGDDKFESPESIAAFENEMNAANVDWEMNVYSHAVHAFTNPAADGHHIPGIAYNKEADQRSFTAMIALFNEVFGPAPAMPAGQASK